MLLVLSAQAILYSTNKNSCWNVFEVDGFAGILGLRWIYPHTWAAVITVKSIAEEVPRKSQEQISDVIIPYIIKHLIFEWGMKTKTLPDSRKENSDIYWSIDASSTG